MWTSQKRKMGYGWLKCVTLSLWSFRRFGTPYNACGLPTFAQGATLATSKRRDRRRMTRRAANEVSARHAGC